MIVNPGLCHRLHVFMHSSTDSNRLYDSIYVSVYVEIYVSLRYVA